MYRIVIIDDEPVVREGISRNIDWHKHGFELCAACRDGREGLEAIERHQPDVVLTDICMPFVDGLELAAWISERYPGTRTILLTGYDEFEYAHEAVKLKVSGFLLKPITAAELRVELERLRAELNYERRSQKRLQLLHDQLEESMPLLRERFLNSLVKSPPEAVELERRTALLELNLPGPQYIVLICGLDSTDEPDELAELGVAQIMTETAARFPGAAAFSTPNDWSVALLSASDEAATVSVALECAELVAERVSEELGRTVSIGIGDPVAAVDRVPLSYNEARTALEHRLVLGPAQIVTVQQVRGRESAAAAAPEGEARAEYARALRNGDAAASDLALQSFLSLLRTAPGSIEARYLATQRLLADGLNALEALGIEWELLSEFGANPFEQLSRLNTLDSIERWFRRLQTKAAAVLNERQKQHSKRKVLAAEEFIRRHYQDPGLSLKRLCGELSVSKSYFSAMFKEYTGMTFVEYVTALRMERAKELLAREQLRSYEVADQVGFKDAHYFSLTFKKQTGFSPTEFRELARQRQA